MVNIYTYLIDMPVREAVRPCCDGFTVYINSSLSQEERERAYMHALQHIEHGDFDKQDVQAIETEAHKERGINGKR